MQLGGDADMEERAFPNPFPDYEAAAAVPAEEPPRARSQLTPDELGLPFHSDGKVSRRPAAGFGPRQALGEGSAGGGSVRPLPPRRAEVTHPRRALFLGQGPGFRRWAVRGRRAPSARASSCGPSRAMWPWKAVELCVVSRFPPGRRLLAPRAFEIRSSGLSEVRARSSGSVEVQIC